MNKQTGSEDIERLFVDKLTENLREYYSQLGLSGIDGRIKKRIRLDFGNAVIRGIEKYLGGIRGKKMLDVGSGWGEIVVSAGLKGADVSGIEPSGQSIEIAGLRAAKYGVDCKFYRGVGEEMPFEKDTFDLVTSISVLEHVGDVNRVIKECMRVLKPGGHLYISAPNYLYPREGHYKIFWIPFTPKFLGRICLRIRGRNPDFLEHINYITVHSIMRELGNFDVEIHNIAEDILKERLYHPETAASKKRHVLKFIKAAHLSPFIYSLMKIIKVYPGISLIVRKK